MTNGSPLDEQLAKAIAASTAAKQSEADAVTAAGAADAAVKDARLKASQARGALSDKKTGLAMAQSAAKRAKQVYTKTKDNLAQKDSEDADSRVIIVKAELKTAQTNANTAAANSIAAAKSAKDAIKSVTAARQQVRAAERSVDKLRLAVAAQSRQTPPSPPPGASPALATPPTLSPPSSGPPPATPSDSDPNSEADIGERRRRQLIPLPTVNFPGSDGGPVPSFPILTEEIGYPPSPLANTGSGASRSSSSDRGGSIGSVVSRALQDVLGWKINSDDSTGFSGALTQSFQLKMVEGSVVSTWTPRSYAVQTDLSGGISGAQASIYTMANTLLSQLQPLITGLYPLDPASDAADVQAIKDLVSNQLSNLTNEIGNIGGPRVMRVHEYFKMLLGIKLQINYPSSTNKVLNLSITPQMPPKHSPLRKRFTDGKSLPPFSWTNPDTVLGSLGDLRDQLGLFESIGQRFINTVADEQNVTNFRIAIDYANSLLNAWSNSIQFFASLSSPFLGTQLVVISRQLGVINETVDEVRFVLDSVFIGPAQRATYQLIYHGHHSPFDASATATTPLDPVISSLPPIYLEDLLQWVQNFVTGEAQEVIQNGGKLGLGEDFKEMIAQLYTQAVGLLMYARAIAGPGFGTARVQQSLYKLAAQLRTLFTMADSVGLEYIPSRH